MQALTGRTHVQQTLYNPAAHKFVRFAVGGGNVFTWTPRSGGEIETAWKEIISGLLFTTAKEGKSFKGTELSTAERLKLFEETIGTSQWNQLNKLSVALLILEELLQLQSPEMVI